MPDRTDRNQRSLLLNEVYALLKNLVQEISPYPAYLLEIQRVLNAALQAENTATSFTLLPILTCQAAGGVPQQGIPVAAAWRALHIAAHLLDDVQDGDVHHLSSSTLDIPRLINLATGFITLASLALTRLAETQGAQTAFTLYRDFHQAILRTAGGQHLDLTLSHPPDLTTYFHLIGLKSGQPFALATRAAAQAANVPSHRVVRYEQFGYNVGILVQIADDLAGFRRIGPQGDIRAGHWPLPVVYALEVASGQEALCLRAELARVVHREDAAAQVRALVISLGGESYAVLEMLRYRRRALDALQPHEPQDRPLRDWLMRLYYLFSHELGLSIPKDVEEDVFSPFS